MNCREKASSAKEKVALKTPRNCPDAGSAIAGRRALAHRYWF